MKTETHAEKVARLERRLKTRESVVTVWTKKVAETRRELEEARKEAATAFEPGDLVQWGSRADRFVVLKAVFIEPAPGHVRITNGTSDFEVLPKQLAKVGSLIADSNKTGQTLGQTPTPVKVASKVSEKTYPLEDIPNDRICALCADRCGAHRAYDGACPSQLTASGFSNYRTFR